MASRRNKKLLDSFKNKLKENGIDVSEYDTYFKEIENNLKDKKYGLVWEEHTEEIEKELIKKFPILEEEKELRINKGEEYTNNFLIEGDNLESLTALKNMGKKVDVIEIDPPYNTLNTGSQSLTYDDKRVGEDDTFRHSKWLSFMENRLKITRDILTDEGIIFIHIDDNEMYNLKLLCDSVFGEDNFVTNFIWVKNASPSNLSKTVRNATEYVLVYAKVKNEVDFVSEYRKKQDDFSLYNRTNKERELIFKKENIITTLKDGEYSKGNYGTTELLKDVEVVDGVFTEDVEIRSRFTWKQETLDEKVNQGTKILIKSKNFVPRGYSDNKVTKVRPITILNKDVGVGTTLESSKEIERMFGKRVFDYTKPKSLIKYILTLVNNKEATVLDFFAGSGTIGEAVIELNKEDGGDRNFILCTNNENNICKDITYERLNKVINGYTTPKGKKVEGIDANLTYLKTELIEKEEDLIDFEVSEELLESMINNLKVLYNITKEEKLCENLVKLENEDRELYLYTNFYVEHEDLKKVKDSYKPKTIYVSEDNLNDINLNMFDEVRSLSDLLVYK